MWKVRSRIYKFICYTKEGVSMNILNETRNKPF